MAQANKIATITCPRCGATGEAPIWDEIDAQTARRDARHVLNETLFEVKCNQCGNSLSLNYPLVYHDGVQKFLVRYITDENLVDEASRTLAQTARAMRGAAARAQALDGKATPEDADAAAREAADDPHALDGYKLRIVTSRNALREKAVILRNGLDDRAVEVLKVTTFNLADSQGKLKGAKEAYFGGVKKSGDITIDFVGGRRHREMKVPAALYAKVCEDVDAACGTDADDFIVDRAWAQRFLMSQKQQ